MKAADEAKDLSQHLRSVHAGTDYEFGKKVSDAIITADQLVSGKESFEAVEGSLHAVFGHLQGGDFAPTSQCIAAAKAAHKEVERKLDALKQLKADVNSIKQ